MDQAYFLIVLVTPELFECRGGYIVEAFRYCYRYCTNIILLLLHSSVLRQYNWCGPIAVLLMTVPASCVFDFSKNYSFSSVIEKLNNLNPPTAQVYIIGHTDSSEKGMLLKTAIEAKGFSVLFHSEILGVPTSTIDNASVLIILVTGEIFKAQRRSLVFQASLYCLRRKSL